MKKIFADSEEKYLMGVVVYLNATDSILYKDYDPAAQTQYTNVVSKDELIDLFNKGLLIVDTGSNFIRPTSIQIETDYSSVTYITVGASDKAVATTYYSEGYTSVAG